MTIGTVDYASLSESDIGDDDTHLQSTRASAIASSREPHTTMVARANNIMAPLEAIRFIKESIDESTTIADPLGA
ncbi:hypothetical protein [Burkholderia multivorans]|uniref:hypothetical protein n=1 Tax=Burkholderia multivorans TaxID=87883 RepID=UPI0015885165|nr:hypothetical protein [Burkholderia multivorans]MBU9313050.1 hypothetical protein [Burkholderia multivorans]MBU9576003.1 hypothetical protein [Burkholderia multivorans]MDN7953670.1 hypothetical protein [Burkholderia multivorans]MDN7964772.1 hypothetical protein [Burkholderia multivorans]